MPYKQGDWLGFPIIQLLKMYKYLVFYFVKKKAWDIELSDISKDYTDVSTKFLALLEENKRLQTEIDSLTEEITGR